MEETIAENKCFDRDADISGCQWDRSKVETTRMAYMFAESRGQGFDCPLPWDTSRAQASCQWMQGMFNEAFCFDSDIMAATQL